VGVGSCQEYYSFLFDEAVRVISKGSASTNLPHVRIGNWEKTIFEKKITCTDLHIPLGVFGSFECRISNEEDDSEQGPPKFRPEFFPEMTP
jgi:hypothetical protein